MKIVLEHDDNCPRGTNGLRAYSEARDALSSTPPEARATPGDRAALAAAEAELEALQKCNCGLQGATIMKSHASPTLTPRLRMLLLQAVKLTGSYDPAVALLQIEESLNGTEYDVANRFLTWVHSSGKKFGNGNINSQFTEFATLGTH